MHTHPWGSGAGITEISRHDKDIAHIYNVPMYVYGPDGKLMMYGTTEMLTPELADQLKDVLVFDDLPVSTNPIWEE